MNPAPQDLIEGLLNFVSLAENERKLLAAELHDQLLCDLREASLITRRILADDQAPLRTQDRAQLGLLTRGLEQAADEARRIMENLRPSVLDSFGLRSALEDGLRRAAEYSEPPLLPRLHIEVTEEELDHLTEEEQLALYRIVQEALTNASKHARATTLTLRICRAGDELLVQVIDDGVCVPESGAHARARGMENMRFRARLIRAELEWRADQAQGGTVVELRLGFNGE